MCGQLWVVQRDTVTVCPRSSDTFYIVSYYIKWGNTSRTYGIYLILKFLWATEELAANVAGVVPAHVLRYKVLQCGCSI